MPKKLKSKIDLGINFYVTADCDQNCRFCTQEPWRRDLSGYHMPLDEVRQICKTAKAMGYIYKNAYLTGGEPSLWRNLEDGCRLIKRSGVFRKIQVFSNCSQAARLASLVEKGLIDRIITKKTNANPAGLAHLKKRVGKNLHVKDEDVSLGVHKRPPESPVPDTLPAKCCCTRPAAFDGRVMICGLAWANSKRLGASMDHPKIWASNRENWEKAFSKIDKFRMPICSACTANANVWKALP